MSNLAQEKASPLLVVIAFATVYIVWGSTYLFIQKAVHGFPPLLLGVLRFLTAGLIMLAWGAVKGEMLFVARDIRNAAITGILLLFIGNGIVIWVEQYMPSAMVAITLSSGPIWFLLLDKSKWRENFRSKSTIAGLIIGFAGVVMLFGENISDATRQNGSQSQLVGLAMLIIGSIAWSAGSLFSKYRPGSLSAPVNSAWQMIAAGVAFVPFSILRGEPQHLNWHTIPLDAWLSLLYLIFFGSIAAFSAFVWLLQVRSATQVSTHAYVNPVVAVVLGILFANESITLLQGIGLTVILGSVLLINLAKYRLSAGVQQNQRTVSAGQATSSS